MKCAYKDKKLKDFLRSTGIVIQKSHSACNVIRLKNTNTGEEIEVWADCNSSGVPVIMLSLEN